MTIKIQLLSPSRAWFDPKTGKPTREFAAFIHDLHRRTGTQTRDYIAEATATASTAAATSQANSAGVTVPAPGGAVELNPANPLSVDTTTIFIATHTRTGAGASIIGGSVTDVARGRTYYVWYADPADADRKSVV